MIEQAQRLSDCYRLHARSGRLGQVLDQPPADSIIAVGAADAHHPDAAGISGISLVNGRPTLSTPGLAD